MVYRNYGMSLFLSNNPLWYMLDQVVLYYAISYMTLALYQFRYTLSIKREEMYIEADVYYTMWHVLYPLCDLRSSFWQTTQYISSTSTFICSYICFAMLYVPASLWFCLTAHLRWKATRTILTAQFLFGCTWEWYIQLYVALDFNLLK